MRFDPWDLHPAGVRTNESTDLAESGRGIVRPVEHLDLVEAIAHGSTRAPPCVESKIARSSLVTDFFNSIDPKRTSRSP
jgi:hypothetical protein